MSALDLSMKKSLDNLTGFLSTDLVASPVLVQISRSVKEYPFIVP